MKSRVAVVGVVAHDVPQDRPVADLDHRLGHRLAVLAQPEAAATAEQDDLHRSAQATRRRRSGSGRRGARPTRGCTRAGCAISVRRFQGRIRMTSGLVSASALGRVDRDARARREPAVLVRVAVDGVVEEVGPDPAVVEQRVALARRAVARDRLAGSPARDQERQQGRAWPRARAPRSPRSPRASRSPAASLAREERLDRRRDGR